MNECTSELVANATELYLVYSAYSLEHTFIIIAASITHYKAPLNGAQQRLTKYY